MLRQLPEPARDRARDLVGSLCHPQLRARRGLVLGLSNKRIRGRAAPCTSGASSPRPTRTWTSRTGSCQLARPVDGIVNSELSPVPLLLKATPAALDQLAAPFSPSCRASELR